MQQGKYTTTTVIRIAKHNGDDSLVKQKNKEKHQNTMLSTEKFPFGHHFFGHHYIQHTYTHTILLLQVGKIKADLF